MPRIFTNFDDSLDDLLQFTGNHIIAGTPLGIGKPNALLNALYQRVKADPSKRLRLLTALSLQRPQASSALESAFLEPFVERVFGDYVELDYVHDLRAKRMPANISVSEFFLKSGDYLGNDVAQQHYMATHYTHVARDMLSQGVNVIAQAVAMREINGQKHYSYSSNPDVTLDLLRLIKRSGAQVYRIIMVNRELPFMVNDARVNCDDIDAIVDCAAGTHTLFSAPNSAVSLVEYAIGLHTSSLVRDGGTLQIGIGSLGDAICHGLILRDKQNARYRAMLAALGTAPSADFPQTPFSQGLYGCSEMFVNGFMKLMQAGIIRRRVYAHAGLQRLLNSGEISEQVSLASLDALVACNAIRVHLNAADLAFLQHFGIVQDSVTLTNQQLLIDGVNVPARIDHEDTRARLVSHGLGTQLRAGVVLHGGFFLGPRDFYQSLRELNEQQLSEINMTAIGFINQLYGQEDIAAAQRVRGSFINTCMMMTLLGAATSDALESGRVVSGVGGQYNFVAMSHALPDAHSILMLRATREGSGAQAASSNLLWCYGQTTIPRQLRDIVITEYGIADLRGHCDEEVIMRLLAITDSRFQETLLATAKANGKIANDYQIPAHQRHNLPALLVAKLHAFQAEGLLPDFPFGTDLTSDELALIAVLKRMKGLQGNKFTLVKALWSARGKPARADWLQRLKLDKPRTFKDKITRQLFIACQ